MKEISSTAASKGFADMLDAVEHRGETFTVLRRGRPVATVSPARHATLGALRAFLRENPPDNQWADDVVALRRFVGDAPTGDQWND